MNTYKNYYHCNSPQVIFVSSLQNAGEEYAELHNDVEQRNDGAFLQSLWQQ